ncbi:T9SS type B sorting domain-containing protein [Flavobacterium hercynium]|uniref:PKD domain-containing protein n=1 Tax=Flavobacterium hercynium TaxID=387094 RepID=A0A226HIN8_9FLAO|nr:T9SS type B sorting domain-containing protein [Flavobacterium hercynium]OXA93501.1 hypothetical protein B0A66_06635 [Flavobacterium hercynium]SMP32048.1 gliding motility-associated C-terminal domain-containing protein [Flavobacterium hercynium]
MVKNILLFLFFSSFQFSYAQITLTNNIGNTLIKTDMYSCERDEIWSRIFKLSDFGIAPNEQFIIKSGQVGISKSDSGSSFQFYIYSLDASYPSYTFTRLPIKARGARGWQKTPVIEGNPRVIQVDFDEPVVIPAGVERIMVAIQKIKDFYNPEPGQIFIAGTQQDIGESLYYGCDPYNSLSPTTDLSIPVPNANFFINVTGEAVDSQIIGEKVRLSHNICDDVIETDIHSCSSSTIYWARTFTLKDFGISDNEEFTINSGQVAVNKTGWGANINFNIYKIDDNFPSSFSELDLIGSSQKRQVPPAINRNSEILQVDFNTPIVIPAGTKKILVEVQKGIEYGEALTFIGGTAQDNDVSWQRNCTNLPGQPTFNDEYVPTSAFGKPNANFYINVTGNVKNVTSHFEMNFSNICSEFLKEFSIDDKSKIASVIWNFGDPASGTTNTSTDLSPFHDFSEDGKYIITAVVTAKDGTVEVLTETIDVTEPPKAYGINNIYACEDKFGTGISTSFDLSGITQKILGGQIDKTVTFIDGKEKKYNSLPSPFTNTVRGRESITVRVSHKNNSCCYSETSFDLIVNPLPYLPAIVDINTCDDNSNGFAVFDLQPLVNSIIGISTNLKVEFYHENGQKILTSLNSVSNLVAKEEKIKIKVINTDTNCYNESNFKLIVNSLPTANILDELIGCDDNNDGFSEYFDTSHVETNILGNQVGMKISYFDSNGNSLPSPLPNPYTNTTKNIEVIKVRVESKISGCQTETSLVLKTASQPQINKILSKYSCDEGNGVGSFDLSNIEKEIIGNQSGLKVLYFNSEGKSLPSPLPKLFNNTRPWLETIIIRVENTLNNLCYSETSFDLKVNSVASTKIEKTYYLCDLLPSMKINIDNNFDHYEWKFENGTIISNTYEAILVNAGKYTLTTGKIENEIYCENSTEFKLIRSTLPVIKEVKYSELTDHNFIEIITESNGDFEYSIDGVNYQNSNLFQNIRGGTYITHIRDKNGCGKDAKEVILIDYPKFFTPNNDGYNDFWHINDIEKFQNSKVTIFDRYGKLLKELSEKDLGWNGFYNGKQMPSDDYWFNAEINNKSIFRGHFSLKR